MVGPVVARAAEVLDGVEEAAEEPMDVGNAARRSTNVEGGALGRCSKVLRRWTRPSMKA